MTLIKIKSKNNKNILDVIIEINNFIKFHIKHYTLLIIGSASICGSFSPQGISGEPSGENATKTIPWSWQNRLNVNILKVNLRK